jgi:PEP-CTERM motif
MRTFIFASAMLALSMPLAVQAAPTVAVNFPSSLAVPGNNDFITQLAGLGFTRYASTGASLVLSEAATITYYFLGSESGFSDTFTAGTVSLTETSSFENHFGSPILIGSQTYAAGSLAGLLRFTSSGGVTANIGHDGFGIFLKPGWTSGQSVTELYLGYDDQINNADDNHDDFIVRAVISAVPEPGTWAMLLSGFVLVGSLLRRRRQNNGVMVLA